MATLAPYLPPQTGDFSNVAYVIRPNIVGGQPPNWEIKDPVQGQCFKEGDTLEVPYNSWIVSSAACCCCMCTVAAHWPLAALSVQAMGHTAVASQPGTRLIHHPVLAPSSRR